MGERRNRKSLWDSVEETKHPSGMSERDNWTGKDRHSRHNTGRYHELSSSGTTPAPTSGDHSAWPAWESIEENPLSDSFIRSTQNAFEGKEIGGENRYYKNVSPGFDGMEQRNYDRQPENDRSRPQRYLGRGRSRSRSRSRTRGRSRSLSRGKGRERGRGWSRSRSRSRSRGDGSAGGHARSRSPIGDYRRQSHGWSERRSGPDKSSQICREFAAGRCRRANQCRFFHPDNVSRRDEDPVEQDGADAWRYRADHDRVSKQSHSRSHGFEFRDDGSDPYHGKDVQLLNKSRSAIPCKDFKRGNCRWGDNCKFSHHFTTEDGFEKSTRHSSFDDDNESHANKNAKPLCKYFAAGKCDRDNCRFSHENPKLTNLDRRSEVSDNPRFHEKSNRWSGPRRDDITRVSDTVKPTRWSETVVTNMAGTDDTTDGNGDHGRGSSMENERWALPEWTGNSLIREQRQSPPREMGSFGGVMASTESIGKFNMSNEQEHIILHQSHLNQDGTMKVQGQNTIPEDQIFSVTSLPQNISPASHFEQQHQGMVKKNPMNSFGSTVLDEVDSRNTRLPIIFSGQNLNQKRENMFSGHPSSSKGYDIGTNMLIPDRSNGFNTDLNGTETHMVVPLDLQSQMPQNQEAIQPLAMSELNAQTFPYLVTSDQSTMTKSPVAIPGQQVAPATKPMQFLTQRFVNEQSQAHTGTEVSNSMGMMPSFSNTSGHVPFVSVSSAQLNPDTVSRGLLNALDNDGYTSEHMNHNSTGGTEPNSQMLVDRSSTPSVSGKEPDNSKVKLPESTELKPEDPVVDKGIAEENKDIQENKGPSLDGQGKVEDTSANKDNKGMRVFKNALIEFVKELLKPKWKEGRMSREAHKTIVKKVVDKVTTTIQVDHIPKTQDKVELYLTNSKPKIAKLIEAYAERCQKTES